MLQDIFAGIYSFDLRTEVEEQEVGGGEGCGFVNKSEDMTQT